MLGGKIIMEKYYLTYLYLQTVSTGKGEQSVPKIDVERRNEEVMYN